MSPDTPWPEMSELGADHGVYGDTGADTAIITRARRLGLISIDEMLQFGVEVGDVFF